MFLKIYLKHKILADLEYNVIKCNTCNGKTESQLRKNLSFQIIVHIIQ